MRIADVIPKERDEKAKEFYKIMDWYLRKNRYVIEKAVEREMIKEMLYGHELSQTPVGDAAAEAGQGVMAENIETIKTEPLSKELLEFLEYCEREYENLYGLFTISDYIKGKPSA